MKNSGVDFICDELSFAVDIHQNLIAQKIPASNWSHFKGSWFIQKEMSLSKWTFESIYVIKSPQGWA